MKPNWTAIIMTGLTVLVGLACAIIALTLGKGDETTKGVLLATAGAALGSFLKQPHKLGGEGPSDSGKVNLLLLSMLALSAIATLACSIPTKPDNFMGKIVTCTTQNTHNTQAGAAVLNCLTGAAAGNYASCLDGLVTAGYWTVDEIACMVRSYANTAASRLNKDQGNEVDAQVLERANAWIKAERLQFGD